MAQHGFWYKTVMKKSKANNAVSLVSKDIGDDGMVQVSAAIRDGKIVKVTLDHSDVGSIAGAIALSDMIRTPTVLIKLCVNDCGLGDQGVVALCTSLAFNTILRELLLNGNSIGWEGAKSIAHSLKTNSTLETLSMNSNSIGDDGLAEISKSLASSSTTALKHLHMSSNSVGDRGAKILGKCLESNRVLSTIEIWNNNIKNQGAKALATSLLHHNSALQKLNLNCNKIGVSGVFELMKVLESHHPLSALHLEGNPGRKHNARPTRVVIGLSDALSTSGNKIRKCFSPFVGSKTETPDGTTEQFVGSTDMEAPDGTTEQFVGSTDMEPESYQEIGSRERISLQNGGPNNDCMGTNEVQRGADLEDRYGERTATPDYISVDDTKFEPSVNGRNGHNVNDIYEIQNEIAHGSFGTVFNARSRHDNRAVAIKVGMPTILDRHDAYQRNTTIINYATMGEYCQEIKALLRLRNRKSALLYMEEFYVQGGSFYIISEPLKCTLSQWTAGASTMSEHTVKAIAKTLLSGIIYMHSKYVVHRDIKLQNVLFQHNGDVSSLRIIDFGLSRALQSDNEWRKTFVGSLGYIAPEIYKKERYRLEVDMYSFGVLIFRLLSGRRPFSNKSKRELEISVLTNKYTMSDDNWKNVSNEAKDFVRRLIIGRDRRFTAETARLHHWFQREQPPALETGGLSEVEDDRRPREVRKQGGKPTKVSCRFIQEPWRSNIDLCDSSVLEGSRLENTLLVSIIRSGIAARELLARIRSKDIDERLPVKGLTSALDTLMTWNDDCGSPVASRPRRKDPEGDYQGPRRVQFASIESHEEWVGLTFISHTGRDQEGSIFASHLYDSLQGEGIKSFFDSQSIREGDLWEKKIVENVENCAVFVCVLTPRYYDRHWCMVELDLAFKYNKTIIPVYLKDEPPVIDEQFSYQFFNTHREKNMTDPQILLRWLDNIRELMRIQAVRNYSTPKHYQIEMKKSTVKAIKERLQIFKF